jgi:hypothetical protein
MRNVPNVEGKAKGISYRMGQCQCHKVCSKWVNVLTSDLEEGMTDGGVSFQSNSHRQID